MMKKALWISVFAVALGLCMGAVVSAQDAEQPVAATVTGLNYNVLSTLAKDAEAADPALAKLNALKVTEAVGADGKPVDALKGKTLYYVPVKAAAALIAGDANAGKTVAITGKVLAGSNAIIVESFEVKADGGAAAGGGDEWDQIGVKTMSQQAVI